MARQDTKAELNPLSLRFRIFLAKYPFYKRLNWENARTHINNTGVEAQKYPGLNWKQAIKRLHRPLDLFDQPAAVVAHGLSAQSTDEQFERMDRLAKIMAGRGEKARLRPIRLLGELLL